MTGPRIFIKFRCSPAVCIGGALALLILPLRWIFAVILAAVIHELFHLTALRLCGVSIHGITVGLGGAVIGTGPISPIGEFVCALAGPLGSFVLVPFAKWIPLTALCGMLQGIFNLLPVYPLDGGRALRCILQILWPSACDKVCSLLKWFVTGGLLAFGIYAFGMLRLGAGIVIVMLIALHKIIKIKIPCKDGRLGVQ